MVLKQPELLMWLNFVTMSSSPTAIEMHQASTRPAMMLGRLFLPSRMAWLS